MSTDQDQAPVGCPYKLAKPEKVYEGKWITTMTTKFETKAGNQGTWEASYRKKPAGVLIDGVAILARVRKQGKVFILLEKQFRIPANKVCLELPAGLVDTGETIEQAALRELKEETGYTGKVVKVSPISFLDPALTDDSLKIVIVDVDGDSEENSKPVQKLDPTESIETVLIEANKLSEYIDNLGPDVVAESSLLAFAMWNDFQGM